METKPEWQYIVIHDDAYDAKKSPFLIRYRGGSIYELDDFLNNTPTPEGWSREDKIRDSLKFIGVEFEFLPHEWIKY